MSNWTINENYTLELNEILSYMVSTLYNEFPTDTLTIEYLILAILDNNDCHANALLDNYLMSDNLEELRKIYVSVLDGHIKPQLKNENQAFNDDLIKLLNCARTECDKLKSKLVGTEHVLLAILNKDNGFSETAVFDKFRLEYSFIYDKCDVKPQNPKKASKKKTKAIAKKQSIQNNNEPIPLKSQINTKMISTSMDSEFVSKYTTNLNKLALEGKFDKIIGRNDEINEIIKVLSRRKKNNAVLVGEGGCGKTAIVYGIADMIAKGNVPEVLEDKEIIMLNPMALISGTHFRGMFEERVNGLFNELKNSDKYILFIDDIHTVLKNSSRDRDTDISGMIGEILSEGNTKVIGTTTFKDYRNSIESNSSLARKLQKIVIEPTSKECAVEILMANKKYYEDYHNVEYTENAILKAVELAERYMVERTLPDSCFDLIDLAGANTVLTSKDPNEIQSLKKRLKGIDAEKDNALNHGDFEKIDILNEEENFINSELNDYKRNNKNQNRVLITEDDIANVVSEITKVPVSKLSASEKNKIANIDKVLKQSVIGQDEAIDSVCRVIKRNKVGLGDKTKTMANILMVGPTGSGKCVSKNTKIKIRNKKTLEIQELTIEEFKKLTSRAK